MGESIPTTANVVQELFAVIADEGCLCPGEGIPEPSNHVCLPGRAEYVVKLLLVERDALRTEVAALKRYEQTHLGNLDDLRAEVERLKGDLLDEAERADSNYLIATRAESLLAGDQAAEAALRTRLEVLARTWNEKRVWPELQNEGRVYGVCHDQLKAILAEQAPKPPEATPAA